MRNLAGCSDLACMRTRCFAVVMHALCCVCSRSTTTPSVIAVKRPTPKVLQRVAHAAFASGENGVIGHVGRVGGHENDEKQRAGAGEGFDGKGRNNWYAL